MTCKISRKKSKHLNNIVKQRMVMMYKYGFSKKRISRNFKSLYIKSLNYNKIKFHYNYKTIDLDNYISPMDIDFDTYFIVSCLVSSTVKKSRMKNIYHSKNYISVDGFNEVNKTSLNPVLIYFSILYRKETGILYDLQIK